MRSDLEIDTNSFAPLKEVRAIKFVADESNIFQKHFGYMWNIVVVRRFAFSNHLSTNHELENIELGQRTTNKKDNDALTIC